MLIPVEDSLIEELRKRCDPAHLDFEKTRAILKKCMGDEKPLSFCFGIGMAPDNPTVLIDLIVVSTNFLFGFDFKADSVEIGFFQKLGILQLSVRILTDRVKLAIISTGGLGVGYYLNNPLDRLDTVLAFVDDVRKIILERTQ